MKVVFISTMLPSGHYSQYLSEALSSMPDVDLIVYSDKKTENLDIKGCGVIKTVWSKSAAYIPQIIRELRKDRPDVVHIQHEINMYGGILTAALFPILLLALRLLGYRLVVTVHAAVYQKQIDKEFIALFHKNSAILRPIFLKAFFYYVNKSIALLANATIVHTNLTKNILVADYGTNPSMVSVIPISVPVHEINNRNKKPYFLYFGYMVRRKGLGFALDGFKKFIDRNPTTRFKLVLAGGVIKGQEQAFEEIKSMISSYGLQDQVIVKGFIEERDLNQLYWDATAVIIPAKVSMAGSGPQFHAFSYAKCILASKMGHLLETIVDLKTGLLTDNGRWDEAFQFVVDNPEKVSEIELNVAQAAATMTPAIIASKHFEVYRAAVRGALA